MILGLKDKKQQQIQFNKSTFKQIKHHLYSCSNQFVPPLDKYVNVNEYASKLYRKANRIETFSEEYLICLLAYYIDHDRNIAFISNISIEEQYLGLGFGRMLVNTCIKKCQKTGVKGIQLDVFKANSNAINFYSKFDFKIINKYDDIYRLELLL